MARRTGGTAVFGFLLLVVALAGLAAVVARSAPELSRALFGEEEPVSRSWDDERFAHREYQWSYDSKTWSISIDIPQATVRHYEELERPSRVVRTSDGAVWEYAYEAFVNDPDDDAGVEAVAKELDRLGRERGWSDRKVLNFVLSFVQSLKYTSDEVTTSFDEYPRYPLQTLADEGGDCEDTSILYASLVLALGYGAVLVSPPQHMGVGVLGRAGDPGFYYEIDDQVYYYAETTGRGYRIGDLPQEYRGTQADIYYPLT